MILVYLLFAIIISMFIIYIYNYQKRVKDHIIKTDEMHKLIKEIHNKLFK